ncbi:HAMP domain-containing sensor histidine kinase [Solibacillus merdavium]|uniref:Heme sensor protein HssS n=1 Tax=Solibacillus merdavium TaxID=2762218 RepID=A0ABR8XM12_9BACL|nr:HAMP domain-containing sensor histidine kinase [Solibacillus merdavium]MBD8032970.1 HAMP domain-containing histidine kinase [Solibacillus merdavium]
MKSLYAKFVITTVVIMVFSSIVAFFFSNLYYQQSLKPQNDEKTTLLAVELANYIETHPELELHEYLQHSASLGYHIMVFNRELQSTTFQDPFRDTSIEDATIQQVLDGTIYHGILQFPHQTFVTGFFANELKNSIGVPLQYQSETYALFVRTNIKLLFNEMHFLFATILLLMIILSILLVLLCTKLIVKPITKLTEATTCIAKGKYDIKLDIKRLDELGRLSQSFMQMSKQLSQVEEKRKEFIANISHDFQSPLSNIKGYVTLIEKEHPINQKYINTIHHEITRLSTMTNQLLQLTTLDQQDLPLKPKLFSVSKQIKQLLQHYEWQIQQKNLMLSYSLPEVQIYADAELLNAVWDNLLSNAIKYTNEFGSIDIELIEQPETVTITFEDNGIGISEHDQQQIFERFYRADSSRTRTIEGIGLGLSIVKSVLTLHNGTIHFTSKPGVGTTVTVTVTKTIE